MKNQTLSHAAEPATNSKASPGPWRVLPDPFWAGKHPCHDHRFITTNHEPVVIGPGWRFDDSSAEIIAQTIDSPHQAANARLLAAAPDLLAALKLLVESPEIRSEDMQQARIAIAKATA